MSAKRALSLVGVVLGAASLVAGVVVVAFALTASTGPADVVRAYFAALADGDAQRALAYGDVPDGARGLLTDAVLAEQQRIAPIRDVSVTVLSQQGNAAQVSVEYTMGFAGGGISTSSAVRLHRTNDDWWLDETAVGTVIVPSTAAQRLSILGSELPVGRTLLFPGALPVRVDTAYLELVPSLDYVTFGSASSFELPVRISEQGEVAVRHAVRAKLAHCLAGSADPSCPLPADRSVPGSVRGRLVTPLGGLVDLDQHDPAGLIRYAGRPTLKGTWQALDFNNVARRQSGQILLDVRAVGYAADPLRLRWTGR